MSNSSIELSSRPEAPETEIVRVVSDYENERGEHPEIEVDTEAPGLFLFDIDGTLVNAKAIHGPAMLNLYRSRFPDKFARKGEAFEQELQNEWFKNFGAGDLIEHQMLCEYLGVNIPDTTEQKDAFMQGLVMEYSDEFVKVLEAASKEDRENMVLSGVRHFLQNLKRLKIPAAIVTGNTRKSAEAMVKYLDLEPFITGGYDDDVPVDAKGLRRSHILSATLERLRQKGIPVDAMKKMVLGDTEKDFLATIQEDKKMAQSTLVATGDNSVSVLKSAHKDEHTPDWVIPSLDLYNLDKYTPEEIQSIIKGE